MDGLDSLAAVRGRFAVCGINADRVKRLPRTLPHFSLFALFCFVAIVACLVSFLYLVVRVSRDSDGGLPVGEEFSCNPPRGRDGAIGVVAVESAQLL
ncbi:hypothetical protein ACMT1E_01190 [Sphingomonas flavalba]|uniref:hypothetical protein n=1 Tax=Sphingomonas flavalba TaxID=2559804 RepID=UPI0039E17742